VTKTHPTPRRPATRGPSRPAPWADPLLWARAGLLLAILLFGPGLLEQFETPKSAAVRALGLGALAAALLSTRGLRRLAGQPLDLAVAGWLTVEVLSTCFSAAPRLSLLGDTELHEGLLTSLGLAGLYVAARWGLSDPGRVRTTLLWAVAAATVASAYALLQVAGLDLFAWSRTALYGAGGTFVRPFGTLGHTNLLGAVTAATLALALALAALERRGRWPLLAAALCLATVTLLTLSRSAWLGAVAGVLTGGALAGLARAGRTGEHTGGPATPSARWQVVLPAVLLVAAGGLVLLSPAGDLLRARFAELLSPGGGSGRSRLEIWKATLACWRERPWLGQGPDTFALSFPRFQTPDYWRFEWGTLPAHAHSIYLHTLATRGGLGLAAGAAWALGLLLAARRGWHASAAARRLLAPLLATFAALAVAGAFGALGLGGATLLVVASAAVAALAGEQASARSPRVTVAPDRRAWLAGLLAAALALAWTTGDLLASRAAYLARAERETLADPASARRAVAAANRAVAIRPHDDVLAQRRAETFFLLSLTGTGPAAWLTEAERSGRRAVELQPLRDANHRTLGNVLLLRARLGDPSAVGAAEQEFARCFELAPVNALAMLQLAQGELALGRPRAALPVAARAARLYPGAALTQAMLAETRLALGEPAAARAALKRALAGEWYGEEAGRALARSMLDSLARPAPRTADAGQGSRRR
jgi:O-antigen ligase